MAEKKKNTLRGDCQLAGKAEQGDVLGDSVGFVRDIAGRFRRSPSRLLLGIAFRNPPGTPFETLLKMAPVRMSFGIFSTIFFVIFFKGLSLCFSLTFPLGVPLRFPLGSPLGFQLWFYFKFPFLFLTGSPVGLALDFPWDFL